MAIVGPGDRKDVSTKKVKPAKRMKKSLSMSMTEDENLSTDDMSNKEAKQYSKAKRKKARSARQQYNKQQRKSTVQENDIAGGLNYGDAETALSAELAQDVKNITRTELGYVGEVDGELRDLSSHFDEEGSFLAKEEEQQELTAQEKEAGVAPFPGEGGSNPADNNLGSDELDPGSEGLVAEAIGEDMFADLYQNGKITINADGSWDADLEDEDVKAWINFMETEEGADPGKPNDEMVDYKGNTVPSLDASSFGEAYSRARDEYGPGSTFQYKGKFYTATSASEKGSWWDGTPYVSGETREETINRVSGGGSGNNNFAPTESGKPNDGTTQTADSSGTGFSPYNPDLDLDGDGQFSEGELELNKLIMQYDSLGASDDTTGLSAIGDSINLKMEELALAAVSDSELAQANEDPNYTITGALQEGNRPYAWVGRAIGDGIDALPDYTRSGKTSVLGKAGEKATNLVTSKASKYTIRNAISGIGKGFAAFGAGLSTLDGITNIINGNYGEAGLDFAEGFVLWKGAKAPAELQRYYNIMKNKFGKKAAQDMFATRLLQTPTAQRLLPGGMRGVGPNAWTTATRITPAGRVPLVRPFKPAGLLPAPGGQHAATGARNTVQRGVTKFNTSNVKSNYASKVKANIKSIPKATKYARVKSYIIKHPQKFIKVIAKRFPNLAVKLGIGAAGYTGPQAAEPISTVLGAGLTAWALYDIYDIVDEIYNEIEGTGTSLEGYGIDSDAENAWKAGIYGTSKNLVTGKYETLAEKHQANPYYGPKFAMGGKLYSNGGETLKERREKPGSSNAGKYTGETTLGASGGADAGSYPVTKDGKPSQERIDSLKKLAHNAPNEKGLLNAAHTYAKDHGLSWAKSGGKLDHQGRHNNMNDASYNAGGMMGMGNMESVDMSNIKPKGIPGSGGGFSNIPLLGALWTGLTHGRRKDEMLEEDSEQRKMGRNITRAMGYPAPNLSEEGGDKVMSAKKGGKVPKKKKRYVWNKAMLDQENENNNNSGN